MRAHTSGRMTSFVTMREMQCAGVRSYILQGTMWAIQCVSPSPKTYPCRNVTEVSSSVPHFLQMGSLYNLMICKCLLKVLCPVSRPVTTLDCVLLKDNSRAPIAGSGPEMWVSYWGSPVDASQTKTTLERKSRLAFGQFSLKWTINSKQIFGHPLQIWTHPLGICKISKKNSKLFIFKMYIQDVSCSVVQCTL
jgi:hypothetical protein